jgi:hypothetical protein
MFLCDQSDFINSRLQRIQLVQQVDGGGGYVLHARTHLVKGCRVCLPGAMFQETLDRCSVARKFGPRLKIPFSCGMLSGDCGGTFEDGRGRWRYEVTCPNVSSCTQCEEQTWCRT